MDKWDYIKKISFTSDKYGNLLVELMEECSAINLQEVPEDKAKEFYERKVLKNDSKRVSGISSKNNQ